MAIEKTILIDVESKEAQKSINSLDKGLTGLDDSASKGASAYRALAKELLGVSKPAPAAA